MTAPWYVEAFRAGYLNVYVHRDEASAAGEVAFPVSAAVLASGARVLDAGCGAGRHARALAACGLRVTGLDLSDDLLSAAGVSGGGPAYVRGDLRALPFHDASFDGVLSFFTSFGYFDDVGNARHARELRRVLRPSGRLVLDFLHAPRVCETLVPRSEKEVGGVHIVEERAIRGGRVEKDVVMTLEDGSRRQWRESVRLYDPAEIAELLVGAGFRVISQHGDLGGTALTPSSSRCVTVAEAV